MKRIVITSMMASFFASLWQAWAVFLPDWLNLFFFPPVVLVFSLQYFKPLETINLVLICGFIADIIGGFALGTNMLIMLLIAFLLGAVNTFSGRLSRRELSYYVVGVSFLYRLVLCFFHLLTIGSKTNFSWLQLLTGPIVDGLFSVIFYYCLVKILSLVRAFEQSDFFGNRIGFHRL